MSLLLVPASKENLDKSINKPVDISFVEKYLPTDFIEQTLKYAGIEGIRCWALTNSRVSIFNDIKSGDEVLFTEKNTGLFTHYGVVIGKTQNVELGNALWPYVGENPWEFIYFLANITNVKINKEKLVTKLGYKSNFTVSGVIKVDDKRYLNFGTISKHFEILVSANVAECNAQNDFSSEDILASGKRRIGHTKFSKQIKANYNYACAICGINETELLVAAHITPWSEDNMNRLNPQNGICLCSLHDKAFEHGYIGLTDDFRIIINPRLTHTSTLYLLLKEFQNKHISIPVVDKPESEFLNKHRIKHNIL